jgi:predicted GNAT family N-acyltransferase
LELIESVGWAGSETLPANKLDQAVNQVSSHYTAWSEEQIIGVVRVMSDGLIFSCIPEILVKPHFQGHGIGAELMKMVIEDYGSTIVFLGAQAGNETFFEKLGFKKGPQSYERCFYPPRKNK